MRAVEYKKYDRRSETVAHISGWPVYPYISVHRPAWRASWIPGVRPRGHAFKIAASRACNLRRGLRNAQRAARKSKSIRREIRVSIVKRDKHGGKERGAVFSIISSAISFNSALSAHYATIVPPISIARRIFLRARLNHVARARERTVLLTEQLRDYSRTGLID